MQTIAFRCLFDAPGEFKRELKIKTDAQEAPVTLTIEVFGATVTQRAGSVSDGDLFVRR